MAIAQQHDVSTMNLQRSANSLRIETRFLPTHGVTILCDTSTDQFRPFSSSKVSQSCIRHCSFSCAPRHQRYSKAISQRYVWPGMHHDIKLWCRSCIACQQSKIHRHTISPLQSFPPSSEKFQHIHVDIVGPLPESCGCSYLLTITDRFSRWVEALPLTDITAKSCADAFVLHFVARYGAPYTITTDRGRQFTSQLWKDLTNFLGSELIHTTSYNPKANGLVERFHRVLKASLKSQSELHNWYSNLGWVLLGIRSTIRENNDFSAAEMIYGTPLRLPGEYFADKATEPSASKYVKQLQNFVHSLQPTATRHAGSQTTYINKALASCSHVFVRHDSARFPLQR